MAVQSEIKALMDSLAEPRLLIREDFSVAYANVAFVHRYGQRDYEGRPCHEVVFHSGRRCSACGEVCPLEQSMVSRQTEDVYRRQVTLSGTRFVELSVTPIVKADGAPVFYMETVRDTEAMGGQLRRAGLVTKSLAVKRLLPKIAALVPLDVPVLLSGETGTGKEVYARVIHENSRRASQPFLHLECLTLTEEKLGRELNETFGEGLAGGTLYLSDVAELTPEMQTGVLQLLKSGRYITSEGGTGEKADIRLVFGTQFDLRNLVERGRFNEELFYRLAVGRLNIPRLHERREDIPELCRLILQEAPGGRERALTDDALAELMSREWPGNVAELQAVLHRVSIFSKGEAINREDVLSELGYVNARRGSPEVSRSERLNDDQYLRNLLDSWQGSRQELARELGISVRTLYRQIRKLGQDNHEA